MSVPYIFATATSNLPLAQLDANFTYFTNAITVSSGNVGIGTSSPSAKLHVDGGSVAPNVGFSFRIDNTSIVGYNGNAYVGGQIRLNYGNGTYNYCGINFSNFSVTSQEFFGVVQNSSGFGDFVWQGYNGSYSERMRIDSSGNVGIGATSITSLSSLPTLQVGAVSGGAIRFGTLGYIYINSSLAEFGTIGATDISFFTNNSSRMRIDSSGNVGIGVVPSGTYKIQVNGQPAANGYTAWTNYSDERLKENITDFNGGLTEVLLLRPRSFNYNELTGYDEATRARKVSGFIAQELKEVCPKMVGTTVINDVEYFDTNTSDLTLLLVKAIQELKSELDSVKSQLAALQGN